MRFLFDLGHPAHFHLFHFAIEKLKSRGHQVLICTRDKDIIVKLLQGYGYEFHTLSRQKSGVWGLFLEYLVHSYNLYRFALTFKPDLIVGCTPSVSLVSKFCPARSIIFSEDDPKAVPLAALLTYPLADFIFMPDVIKSSWPKRISYSGYHKLAYLHPNHFTPNPAVLPKLGVLPGEPYFILRFVSFHAAHDHGESGLNMEVRENLIRKLSQIGRIFITSESPLPEQLEPYRIRIAATDIHDALYYATMLVGDSQTMTAEAAILGTPAIRFNTFVGRISYLDELENRYQLTFGFTPDQEDRMFNCISDLLSQTDLKSTWQKRRMKMLSEKIDVTAWMVDLVENIGRGQAK